MDDILIFDLDGTLIDSAPDLRKAANKVLSKHGRRPISMEETKKFVGNGAAKLMERAFRATGKEVPDNDIEKLTQDFLAFYDGHEADETRPYEGVVATLETLKDKGYRMALCTNKPHQPTNNLLKDLGLDRFFEIVLGGDMLDHKKPHPQMILWILDKMGCEKKQAIMIGDSPNDITGARNAGIRNIAVSYGYRKVPVEDLQADHVIDHFPDLLHLT